MFNDSKGKPGLELLPLPWQLWAVWSVLLCLSIGVWFGGCYLVFHVWLGWL